MSQLRSWTDRPARLDAASWSGGPTPPVDNNRGLSAALTIGLGIVIALGFVLTMLEGNYNQFGGLLVAMFLLLATVPLARHAARVENWPGLSTLIMAALVLRLGGSVARYLVAYGLYGGVADASTYQTVALHNYQAFRHLHVFWPNTSVDHNVVPWADTVIYAVAGPTELGSFFVFAGLNFFGCYLFYRAFRMAFPEGDGRRYAYLVLLLPSLLYWPSSLGKEGWMIFALGLASYGLARALAGRLGGYTALVAGLACILLVRPHLALIFLPAALLSLLLRRRVPGGRRPLTRVIGVLVIVVVSLVAVGKVQSYFGIKNLDVQSVTQELKTTRATTAEGNSAFTPPNAQSPLGYPEAAVTVLFRPFPFEAKSSTVLVSSGEGLLLLGLAVASWRRLRRLPHFLVRNPYVMFSFIYCALFILAFANFSNFGILARERTQMLPMVLVMLALPLASAQKAALESEPAAVDQQAPRTLRRYDTRRPSDVAPPHPGTAARSSVAGPYRGLGCTFDVEVAAGPFRAPLRRTLADLSSPGPATVHYRLDAVPDLTGLNAMVTRQGQLVGQPAPIPEALVHLLTDVNFNAVASRSDKLVLHAGAVTLRGFALLLPGHSGAGKSTLTAALVSRGFDYLSDEAAAVDPVSLEIEPYPKPLTLSADSLAALGHTPIDAGGVKQVVASGALRAGAVGRPALARALVFPAYQAGATSTLNPMSRAEALVEAAGCSFNFVEHGGEWMPLLHRLVAGCWCGRLTIGDLEVATELLLELVHGEGGVHPQ